MMKYPKRINIACEQDLYEQVNQYSATRQQSVGATIRQAAIYYLESVQS